ncbi:MAG: transposase [Nanoarchaeota archaeon]
MSQSKCSLDLYIKFLIANQNKYSGVELSKTSDSPLSHDSVSKWLRDENFTSKDLWPHVKDMVRKEQGYLIADDSVLDKRFSRNNELVGRHWSGNEHRLICGIDLVSLLWTKGAECIPCDYRIYQSEQKEKKTKNEHFRDMLITAKKRGFKPKYVLADCWYGSVENMKYIEKQGWKFVFGAKENRKVSITKNIYVSISNLDWSKTLIQKVWLKEFGYIMAAKIVIKDDDVRFVVTNDLSLTNINTLKNHNEHRWNIETFHRGIKQTTGIEKCYSILERSQRNHIFASFIAFVKLEYTRLEDNISWYEQKAIYARIGTRFALSA